ncbi:MAG: AMP-binding protein [Acidobacteria bacterium]|nr:AMP-binding protein [Acidobacteriota bacterium]
MHNLLEFLWKNSISKPQNLAYRFLETGDITGPQFEITWLELANRVRAVAATLQRQAQVGDRALLLYSPGLDFVIAIYACFAAGVIAVPGFSPENNRINRTLPRLQAIVLDASAKVVLTSADLLEAAEPLCTQVNGLKHLQWIATDMISTTPQEWKECHPKSEDLAYLQYTSGSTGDPKGVMVTHNNLVVSCLNFLEHLSYNFEKAHHISWLPIYHDLGLIWGLMTPVVGAIPCTFMSPTAFLQKPSRWLKAISHFRGTAAASPNFGYDLCLRKVDEQTLKNLDLSCLEVSINAAEPVRAETMDKFQHKFGAVGFRASAMCPGFGLAENTLQVTLKPPVVGQPTVLTLSKQALEQKKVLLATDEDSVKIVGCGPITDICAVNIVNSETFAQVPSGIGEIWLSGALVTKGYWGHSELSKKIFQANIIGDSNSWLRTGDLGFIYNNELFITGRYKDLIIVRGRNLYPQDIEKKVEEVHQAIRPGCVIAFSIEINEEEKIVIVAEVDSKSLKELKINALLESIHFEIVNEFQVEIRAIVLIEQGTICKTSSGKLQRRACHKLFLEGALSQIAAWTSECHLTSNLDVNNYLDNLAAKMPVSTLIDSTSKKFINTVSKENNIVSKDFIKQWIKEWTSKKTGIEIKDIQMDKEFTHYGFDSLAGVTMAQDLEDVLGFPIPPTITWDYPTLNKATDYIYENISLSTITKTPQNIIKQEVETPKTNSRLDSLFEQIENLSDDEASKLIAKNNPYSYRY